MSCDVGEETESLENELCWRAAHGSSLTYRAPLNLSHNFLDLEDLSSIQSLLCSMLQKTEQ